RNSVISVSRSPSSIEAAWGGASDHSRSSKAEVLTATPRSERRNRNDKASPEVALLAGTARRIRSGASLPDNMPSASKSVTVRGSAGSSTSTEAGKRRDTADQSELSMFARGRENRSCAATAATTWTASSSAATGSDSASQPEKYSE